MDERGAMRLAAWITKIPPQQVAEKVYPRRSVMRGTLQRCVLCGRKSLYRVCTRSDCR